MSTNTPDPTADKDFAEKLIVHLANPCGTDAGNIREFYIREAERELKEKQ